MYLQSIVAHFDSAIAESKWATVDFKKNRNTALNCHL